MKVVFIGGSRRLSRLNEQVRLKLAEIAERKLHIVIGDANGADRAVQALLAEWQYPDVTIYYVGRSPRNNLGDWHTTRIAAPSGTRGFEFYATKDKQMARDAQCGLMIWDGESRGTLTNVKNLVAENKPVAVYVSRRRRFLSVVRPEDIALLSDSTLEEARTLKPARVSEQAELDLFLPSPKSKKRRRRTA